LSLIRIKDALVHFIFIYIKKMLWLMDNLNWGMKKKANGKQSEVLQDWWIRHCLHDFIIYPFIHFIVIHKNKRCFGWWTPKLRDEE
jgi:hypothetical protein